MSEKTIHQGRNVKRFREMLQMKQDVLADALGNDWNQKKISLLESKEIIEPAILVQVANALKVPVEAIKNFDEQTAINNIQNNYDSSIINSQINYQFNTIERWVEALEENKKLYATLLKEKDEKIALLERILATK